MILMLHANFNCLGEPTHHDLLTSPLITSFRTIQEFATNIGVNVFILISGWFGIKGTIKGALKLLFQSGFFMALGVIFFLIKEHSFSITGILNVFTSYKLWFIPAYLGLYILSPVLNHFLEIVSKRMFINLIIAFYIFQTFYGYFPPFIDTIGRGYSTISFIGLYLLSGGIKRHFGSIDFSGYWKMYILMIALNSVLFIGLLYAFPSKTWLTNGYIDPMTVLGALSITLWFSSVRIGYVKIINYISKSCFGVFLLHSAFYGYYKELVILSNVQFFGGQIATVGVVVVFFMVGVLLDKVREMIWNYLINRFQFSHLNTII